LIRPLRFLAVSIPLFLLWTYALRDPWMHGIAEIFAGSARLFGLDIHLVERNGAHLLFSYGTAGWENEFGLTSINIVPYIALVLATATPTWRRQARMLAVGIPLLALSQVLGLWTDVLSFLLRHDPGGLRFANGLRELFTGFGTFLFPLLIWLVQVRDLLPLDRLLHARH
jgi:hypothetical protein